MQYRKARDIAVRVLKLIEPHCKRSDIAGSIAREKSEVGDIELVVEPRTIEKKDLFGNVEAVAVAPYFISTVNELGTIVKGQPTGRYMRIDLPDGIALDLFMPEPSDFYRIYSIRIGSADFSAKVLATSWVKKGWRGTPDGLRLESECFSKDLGNGKLKWICTNKNPTLPPVWENEYDFFKFLGLDWIPPSKRYV